PRGAAQTHRERGALPLGIDRDQASGQGESPRRLAGELAGAEVESIGQEAELAAIADTLPARHRDALGRLGEGVIDSGAPYRLLPAEELRLGRLASLRVLVDDRALEERRGAQDVPDEHVRSRLDEELARFDGRPARGRHAHGMATRPKRRGAALPRGHAVPDVADGDLDWAGEPVHDVDVVIARRLIGLECAGD